MQVKVVQKEASMLLAGIYRVLGVGMEEKTSGELLSRVNYTLEIKRKVQSCISVSLYSRTSSGKRGACSLGRRSIVAGLPSSLT